MELEAGGLRDLEFLASMPGAYEPTTGAPLSPAEIERRLYDRLRHYHLDGVWFRAADLAIIWMLDWMDVPRQAIESWSRGLDAWDETAQILQGGCFAAEVAELERMLALPAGQVAAVAP
jgi:hypothetical protein